MKYLLLLLVSINSFAATPGAVPSVTLSATGANTANVSITPAQLSGPCTTASSSPCFSLYVSGVTPTGAGYFILLYRNGAAYVTPSNQKTYCFDITASDAVGSAGFQLVSSQASITNNTNTALTSGVYQGGATTVYPVVTGPTANVQGIVPGVYTFGDGSHATYAAVQVATTHVYEIHMDCFEQ